MPAAFILAVVVTYFIVLFIISRITGRDSSDEAFFVGNKQSPWYLVAFGMIGASLSGITFISIPGWVGDGPFKEIVDGENRLFYYGTQFSYMQMVLGYLVGYVIIATVLMPLYYRLNLTSIYGYLEQRFGMVSYKTGSAYFMLSRTIGASLRLYLVVVVLQEAIFNELGVPFWATIMITISLIWVYTYRGGIRTIVWTDSLQTLFMLLSVGLCIWYIGDAMNLSFSGLVDKIADSDYSQVFFFEEGWADKRNFFKKFLGGASIALVMTGLDQDMMQKNLSCKNIGEAQKNMFWFSVILVFVNLLFLALGALLFIYASENGIALPERSDSLFHIIAFGYTTPLIGVVFLIGLLAAAYSSADSALTSLTTAFCVDFLGFKKGNENKATRYKVHIGFSLLLMFVIMAFYLWNNEAAVWVLFKMASLTYGPLLGLYAFGLFTKRKIKDNLVAVVCVVAPILSFLLNRYSETLLFGYKFDFELLIVNALITFCGLWFISSKGEQSNLESAKQ